MTAAQEVVLRIVKQKPRGAMAVWNEARVLTGREVNLALAELVRAGLLERTRGWIYRVPGSPPEDR